MNVGLIIPAYNAGEELRRVIEGALKQLPASSIHVVDDGSTDGTAGVAGRAGVRVIRHPINRGKGEALKTGFRSALERDWEAVITLDGDGQHSPDSIPDFIRTLQDTGCDIVLGRRRFRPGEMPLDRILSNRISSGMASWLAGTRILDSQSGYRMIRAEVVRNVGLKTSRFETETELLVRAAWAGFRIGYCPIPNVYAGGSHIRRTRDTIRFCRLFLALLREKRKYVKTS